MSDLLHRAQLELLAKLLHVTPERIEYLERYPADELYALRERISDAIFDANSDMFRRISALVPIVPLGIVMPIIQKICPPEMGGRAAGAIAIAHPKKVAHGLSLVKPEYGASAAPFLDPRAVRQVAHLAPPKPVVAIANVILERKDYVTAGQFVDAATPELIVEVEKGTHDDAGLLRSGAYVFSAEAVNNVVRVIAENNLDRVRRIIVTMLNGERSLQLAGLSVFSRLEPNLNALVGDILVEEGDEKSLHDLFRTYIDAGVEDDLDKVLRNLHPDTFAKLETYKSIAKLKVLKHVKASHKKSHKKHHRAGKS
ncbi:MAG: hypothetical protein LLG14_19820 [Nocardiaceae bacterium]|nr:hypothetical protein [Nocardiaceae bacterium]